MNFSIESVRRYYPGGAHHLLYEYEDIMAQEMSASIVNDYPPKLYQIDEKINRRLHINLLSHFRFRNVIKFWMSPYTRNSLDNSPKVIPWVVDFYIPEEKFPEFFKATSRNKVVFISSLEAWTRLSHHQLFTPQKYIHLPLSISDIHHIDVSTKNTKKYDLAMLGRCDSQLMRFVEMYSKKHPSFTYVTRTAENGFFSYYLNTSCGEKKIAADTSHTTYLDIMRASKIGIWSTRGLEDPKCNGYNQVTPRFLELLVSGCHIIARYPQNEDTDFFQISKFSNNVETYEVFESLVDKYLITSPDMSKYVKYISDHYTSIRVSIIKKVLSQF